MDKTQDHTNQASRWSRPELKRLGTIRDVAGGGFTGNDGNSNCNGKANQVLGCPS